MYKKLGPVTSYGEGILQDESDAEDFYSIRDCMPDINRTYRAVVEFIKWYQNK